MTTGLRFNKRHVETSHTRNDDLDIDARIKNSITPRLSYACNFCAEHLQATTSDIDLLCNRTMAQSTLMVPTLIVPLPRLAPTPPGVENRRSALPVRHVTGHEVRAEGVGIYRFGRGRPEGNGKVYSLL
jgi:hypothetical protein